MARKRVQTPFTKRRITKQSRKAKQGRRNYAAVSFSDVLLGHKRPKRTI